MVAELFDPARTGLLLFDMLKGYAYGPDLDAVVPEARDQVVACVRLLQAARQQGIPVFYAQADHRPDGRDHALAITDIDLRNDLPTRTPFLRPGSGQALSSGQASPRKEGGDQPQLTIPDPRPQTPSLGIVSGAKEAEIIDELAPQPHDYVIRKHRWSAFFQTELELSLRARGIDTLLVTGGSTEVGIGATAYAARDLDISTILVRECIRSGRGSAVSDYCMDQVFPRLSRVRSVDEIVAALENGGLEPGVRSQRSGAEDVPQATRHGPPISGPATAGSQAPDPRPQASDPPLDPKRTGLVLFDTLKRYFYDESLSEVLPETKNQLAACQGILAAARKLGLSVFYPAADHREDGADWATATPDVTWNQMAERFGRLRVAPGLHHGGESAQVVPELAPKTGDYLVLKHRWSAFQGTHLELSLRTAGVDTILLAGGSTEVGIISTAYGARDRDFSLVILGDACRSARPGMDDFLMEHVFPRMARVRTVEQTLGLLAPSEAVN